MKDFIVSVVTERFIEVFNLLKTKGFFSTNKEFAERVDYLPQSLGEITKKRRDVTIEVIRKLVTVYPVSSDYIFTGEGEILSLDEKRWLPEWLPIWLLNNKKKSISGKTESTNIVEFPVVSNDDSEMVSIPIVDISVAAGSGFYNPDQLHDIDSIRLPRSMTKNGTYLCVRIKGESMVPTLLDGGYLVIRLLEQSDWQNIRDGHVYVVAEKDGRAFVKRLKNRFLEHGFIVCNSDSADVMRYPSFNLFENEINTIWHAEWYFTAKMPNINDTYYNRLTLLEEGFEELRKEFSQMRALQQKN